MRLTEFVDGVAYPASGTGTVTTVIKSPTWANRATFTFATNVIGTGTGSSALTFLEVAPAFTVVPAVAETTTGTTGTFEVQTITMTGEPTDGSFTVGVVGVGTTTVYTTPFMPLKEVKNRASRITDHLIEAGLPNAADVKWTVTVGTGSSTPTVFTATFSGTFVNNQTAIVVDGSRLFKNTTTALALGNMTAITVTSTTGTNYEIMRVGPGETGIADVFNAGHITHLNMTLPEYIACKVVSTATAVNTVEYSLYVTYSS